MDSHHLCKIDLIMEHNKYFSVNYVCFILLLLPITVLQPICSFSKFSIVSEIIPGVIFFTDKYNCKHTGWDIAIENKVNSGHLYQNIRIGV